jgi:opacity protein-like surface antigen
MQGKRLLLAILSGVAALSTATPALAIMSAPMGWYLEGNGGTTKLSNKSYNGSASSSGIGVNANLGYKFMPYFATEIGYTRYADTSIKDSNSTRAGNDKHYSYDLSFRGILPAADTGLEAFAKAGVERVASHISITNSTSAANLGLSTASHSSTGLYLGAGVQYYFMPELAVVAQWQRAYGNSNTGTMDLYSGGISFIFD